VLDFIILPAFFNSTTAPLPLCSFPVLPSAEFTLIDGTCALSAPTSPPSQLLFLLFHLLQLPRLQR